MWRYILLPFLLALMLQSTSAQTNQRGWFSGLNRLFGFLMDNIRPGQTRVRTQSFNVVFGPDGTRIVSLDKNSRRITPKPVPSNPTPPPAPGPTDKEILIEPERVTPKEPVFQDFPGTVPTLPVEKRPQQPRCPKEYMDIAGHTMCMPDDPRVTNSGVTNRMKKIILDLHNDYRSKVKPEPADLVVLHWNDDIAAVAQKWANQCEAGHDRVRNVVSLPGMTIGQNVAGGYKTWQRSIQLWYEEVHLWTYGRDADSYPGNEGWKEIGHFTQMVQNGTYLIGCGFANCQQSVYRRYYVCNYANGQSNLATPYTLGKPISSTKFQRCSACPNSCRNGQCDCNGQICLNGGKLNPNTCKCKCPKIYLGKSCEILKCPRDDAFICGRHWPKNFCDRYYNIPWDCPYMCGICKRADGSRPSFDETYRSKHGCTFKGRRSTPEECRAYGDRGQDIFACRTNGGNLTCSDCKKYFNVPRDMCPVMCGLCDPPCNGKKCENGGVLDTDTCRCRCKLPYRGRTCTDVNCKIRDRRHCKDWPVSYCTKYSNVPLDCRHRCNLCK